ncbi:hypothetical protein K466DRAFT_603381 [Polyporus arcularius HHB13444]|uniref:Uncharacterized protein n=1 Tax=Polyporus arcularius HHB13444 TaxID=1314778 RepID=A0A5C3P1S1_9APHY|nr:hypothetical protein K466DRAFT_603381 [Polyporus arcularius HHB13444]
MCDLFPLPPNTVDTETDADVRRDIAFLSALLKDYHSGKSTVLDAKRPGSSRSDLWSYLSYILVPGGFRDEYGDNVVPVVGKIEPGSLAVTVVAQSTSPTTHSGNKPANSLEVDEVALLEDGEVTGMLARMAANVGSLPDDVDFEVHLRDTMSIISYLLHYRMESRHLSQGVLVSYLFEFVVLRCYRKLFARLASGITLWTKHPLELLNEHYEKTLPAPGQDASRPIKMPQAYKYKSLLSAHGIIVTANESGPFNVAFSSSVAPVWAKLLHTCYTTMCDTLSHEQIVPVKQTGKKATVEELKRVARRPITAGECRNLEAAIALLNDALSGGIVARLFSPPLVDKLNAYYVASMQVKTNSRLARGIYEARTGEGSEVEYHYDADDLQANGEDTLRHIVRHLEALATPLRAAYSIVHSCFDAPPDITSLKAYRVVTPDSHATFTADYFERFREELASRWGEQRELVLKALDSSKDALVRLGAPSVHGEAALINILSAGDLQEHMVNVCGEPTPIASLLSSGSMPVGVSKRCCFCCWLLAELLKPGSRGIAAQSAFVLRGTHGTIFPWQPPPGVPRAVLEAMRKELLTIFNRAFNQALGVRPQSAQTSPATPLHAPFDVSPEEVDRWNVPREEEYLPSL